MSRNRGPSKNRIRLLSPIREASGIIPVHVVPKGTKVMKGAAGHAPILVQALPEEAQHPKPTMKPIDRHYTGVEQVVADYLHYSRYGQVMPVLYGSGSEHGNSGSAGALRCTCCTDRNRENVYKKMALARGEDISQIPDLSSDAPRNPAKDTPSEPSTIRTEAELSPAKSAQRPVQQVMAPPHAQNRWGYYQPMPYAGTFLNPEFNRPFVLETMHEDDGRHDRDKTSYINSRILEADQKFDQSMKKLESRVQQGFDAAPYERFNLE